MVIDIGAGLACNQTLVCLNMARNEARTEGAIAIGEALKINNVLASLNLEMNRIGNEGAKAIAAGLRLNGALTELNLATNQLSCIDTLKVGQNDYTAECVKALANALRVNRVLTLLNLANNYLTTAGKLSISQALCRYECVLAEINLSNCGYWGPCGLPTLGDALGAADAAFAGKKVRTCVIVMGDEETRVIDAARQARCERDVYRKRGRAAHAQARRRRAGVWLCME